jgi:hypothetical protein
MVEAPDVELIAGITVAARDRPRSRPLDARIAYG